MSDLFDSFDADSNAVETPSLVDDVVKPVTDDLVETPSPKPIKKKVAKKNAAPVQTPTEAVVDLATKSRDRRRKKNLGF